MLGSTLREGTCHVNTVVIIYISSDMQSSIGEHFNKSQSLHLLTGIYILGYDKWVTANDADVCIVWLNI